jgi:hypothetical protein
MLFTNKQLPNLPPPNARYSVVSLKNTSPPLLIAFPQSEITDAQRLDIGCPVHDLTHTPVSRPKAQPEADVVYPGKHLLELAKIRAVVGSMSEDEEKAEFGVRIFWGVLGDATEKDKFRLASPPLTGDDLPHSTFTHRKRYRFDFGG